MIYSKIQNKLLKRRKNLKKIYTQKDYKTQQNIQQKRAFYKKQRIFSKSNKVKYPEYVKARSNKKTKLKKLIAPKNFRLIENNIEVLKFFDSFFHWIDEGYYKFQFNMQEVNELSIETLLYIISLDKIYKEEI